VEEQFVSGVSDESFRITLIQGLFENVHVAIAIGGKKNLLAIEGPIRWKVISIIESESVWVHDAAVSHNVSHINISLRKPL